MKQILKFSLTAAAPYAVLPMALSDSMLLKLLNISVMAVTDNASAMVRCEVAISRSDDPISGASLVAEDAISRGDAFMATLNLYASTAASFFGDLLGAPQMWSPMSNTAELFSSTGPGYVGVRAHGLESGKTATVHVEVVTSEVSATSANVAVQMAQLVRALQVGT